MGGKQLWTVSRKRFFAFGIMMFVGGILFFGVFDYALEQTNTTEFCISCHSMQVNHQELQQTPHYNNRTGVRVGCADCHVPKELGPKLWAKLMAAKDVYHELVGTIDTPEKYEAHRWDMATRVWAKMKASDSRECRNCHSFDAMSEADQDKMAWRKHERARVDGVTCIECHTGIAHTEPDEPAPATADGG